MRRREFLSVLGGAAAWPLAARAQQAMPVIGYLSSGSARGFATRLDAFRLGLQQIGYREGQNVAIEYRWADGQNDQLPAMAADLARRQVNVIAAPGGSQAPLAAKGATATIPIVFETGVDPIAAGIVTSLSRPNGNITGVSSLNVEVAPKRLELLHQLVPAASAFALLVNPTNPFAAIQTKGLQAVARALKLDLHVLQASNDREVEEAFAKLVQIRIGGLVISPDPFYINRSGQIAALTVRHAVVAVFHSREFAVAGGLLSYGGSVAESHRQAGIYTARILKGDKPADLPIQQVTKVEFVINMKSAKTLGLNVPLTLLGRADEVIE
jgi:putative tryptophan/tyrosine transport system substrate-binding protein